MVYYLAAVLLLTPDSTVAASLRERERTDYTLLMTEARYKCWLPVAEDTSITKAADYYRRKGPDKHNRSSLSVGLHQHQRGDRDPGSRSGLLSGIRDSAADKEIKDDIRSIKFMSVFDSILRKHFPGKQTYEKMQRLCGTLYSGVLEQIKREHSSLTQNDLLLIALMGWGFPTGAICAVIGMTIGSLNSRHPLFLPILILPTNIYGPILAMLI